MVKRSIATQTMNTPQRKRVSALLRMEGVAEVFIFLLLGGLRNKGSIVNQLIKPAPKEATNPTAVMFGLNALSGRVDLYEMNTKIGQCQR